MDFGYLTLSLHTMMLNRVYSPCHVLRNHPDLKNRLMFRNLLHNFLYSSYFVHALKIEHCAYYAEIILNAKKVQIFKKNKIYSKEKNPVCK